MHALKNFSRLAIFLSCGLALVGCGLNPVSTSQTVRPATEVLSPTETSAGESPDRILEIRADAFRILDSEGVELQLVPYSAQIDDGIAALEQLFGQAPEIFDYPGDGNCFDAGRAYIWDDLRLVPGNTLVGGVAEPDPGQFGIYASGPQNTSATGAVVTLVGTTGIVVGMDEEAARKDVSPAQLDFSSEHDLGNILFEYGLHSSRNGVSDDPNVHNSYGAIANVAGGKVINVYAPGRLRLTNDC